MAETLTASDLRGLLAVIEEGRRDDPTEGLPWAVLEGLAALVPCDAVSFPEYDPVGGHSLVLQWYEDGDRELALGDSDPPEPPEYWAYSMEFLPCNYPHRTGDLASVVRWSDFYTAAQLRNVPMFSEFFGRDGFNHGMHASLSGLPGPVRKITFWRGTGPDFTERDRLVVELLRPHLWELYLDTQRRWNHVPHLSMREWEVLQLAHQGYDNAQIAQTLSISVSTVRKHLEHIFDRTGVRTRTAAAALMMPHYHGATPRILGRPSEGLSELVRRR
jgi:DNA-binding CsgD family transcriptional regulator